jgi:hypothetical protein
MEKLKAGNEELIAEAKKEKDSLLREAMIERRRLLPKQKKKLRRKCRKA